MTKPSKILTIEMETGRSWEAWTAWLDTAGARDKAHAEIAKLAEAELAGRIESPGWWAQYITVAYEQHIGRRLPGQRSDGSFEVSTSRTFNASPEDLFSACLRHLSGAASFDGKEHADARTSITPKRSYWRSALTDSTRLTWSVEGTVSGKAKLVITHASITSAADAQWWQSYWKGYLAQFELSS